MTKLESYLFPVSCIYAIVSLIFIDLAATGSLGQPVWPTTFLGLAVFTATLAGGATMWWVMQPTCLLRLVAGAIFAAVASAFLLTAYASSAAV